MEHQTIVYHQFLDSSDEDLSINGKSSETFGKYSTLHWLCRPFFFPFSKDHRSILWSFERSFCFSEEKNMSRMVECTVSSNPPHLLYRPWVKMLPPHFSREQKSVDEKLAREFHEQKNIWRKNMHDNVNSTGWNEAVGESYETKRYCNESMVNTSPN